MNGEIIFRGKRIRDGKWVYGFYCHVPRVTYERPDNGETSYRDVHYIQTIKRNGKIGILYEVHHDTIGQFTGLTDKYMLQKIFEYDIIDADGRKVGNYYENSNLLKRDSYHIIERMGTKAWKNSEQEAIKRGCKYAE